jgi:hypothetical protein
MAAVRVGGRAAEMRVAAAKPPAANAAVVEAAAMSVVVAAARGSAVDRAAQDGRPRSGA